MPVTKQQRLYRPATTRKIQEVSLVYIEPGSSQMGIVVEMIRLGLKDTILTYTEQSNLNRDEMFQKCLIALSDIVSDSSATVGQIKQANSLSQILAGVETAQLFHQLIKECFPEIEFPYRLTDETKMEMFMVIFSRMVDNISSAATSIKEMMSSSLGSPA